MTSENLTLRLGVKGREKTECLTRLANYEKPNQFLKALIAHISEVAEDQPFDVRDLVLKHKEATQ